MLARKIISEVDFLKGERLRGGGDAGIGSSGIPTLLYGTRSSLTVVSVSDCDSQFISLVYRRKRPHVLPAPELSDSVVNHALKCTVQV